MKLRLLAALFCFLALASAALAQGGVRYDNIVLSPGGVGIGGATVTVCTSTATGTPCSPTVSIFSNQALTVALSNPISTDQFGNYGFWIAPGTYTVTVTGGAIQSYSMTITPGCIPGATGCASGSGAFAGTLGTSFQDISEIAAPANPSSGNERLYANSTTHQLTCITSSGANCGGSASLPTTLGAPGVFTNTAGVNGNFQVNLNSAVPGTLWTASGQPGADTESITGSVIVPATGTAHQETGVAGYCENLANSNNGNVDNCVGGYFQALGNAAHAWVWGINPLVGDLGTQSDNLLAGEFDVNVANSSSVGAGIQLTGGSTAQPGQSTSGFGSFPAIEVVCLSSTCTDKWTSGYAVGTGATDNGTGNGDALDIGATVNTSGNSQAITLHSFASSVEATGQIIQANDPNNKPGMVYLAQGNTHGVFFATMPVHGAASGVSPQAQLTFATCTLASGTCTYTFTQPYASAPNCAGTWNGTGTLTGILKVVPSTTTAIATSSVGTDTGVIQIVCGPALTN